MLTRLCLAGLLGVLGVLATAAGAGAQEQPQRPNVVVLMTDDQDVDSMRVMPRVQSLLAAEGATFANSFVDFSLCCPSRATFLTGQYAHNHGVRGLTPPRGGYVMLDKTNYLPTWLQGAGYQTMHLGKFLNGYGLQNDPAEVPPGFDVWQGSVDPSSYDYLDFTLNENGQLNRYQGRYQTDFYGGRAADLIRAGRNDPRPFFLSVAFVAPHHGRPAEPDDPSRLKSPNVAARHRDAFSSEPLPTPPSFNEFDVSDKPTSISRRPPLAFELITEMQELHQQRLESLLAVDEAVERIVETLRSTGELDNTLIIFTSDNGYLLGQHRVPAAKVLPYEPSIRVPLVMRGPGVPPGIRRRQLVTNVDLAPTILDAADALAGKAQDGSSLFPLLKDNGMDSGRDLFVEGIGTGVRFSSVRTQRYKYTRYSSGQRELYDLRSDPFELRNLKSNPRFAALRSDLYRRLRGLRRCRGRACRAGRRLNLRVEPRTGCVPRQLSVRMFGRDGPRVKRAAFYVGRRLTARARGPRALERRVLRSKRIRPGRRFQLRVRVVFDDDTVATLDRVRRGC